jgi:5'-methylthioadenosine phosphorylase
VVNMTLATEVTLANEVSIPYAAVAMSTDYDCWKTDEESVSWEAILEIFGRNVEKVVTLMERTIPRIK